MWHSLAGEVMAHAAHSDLADQTCRRGGEGYGAVTGAEQTLKRMGVYVLVQRAAVTMAEMEKSWSA